MAQSSAHAAPSIRRPVRDLAQNIDIALHRAIPASREAAPQLRIGLAGTFHLPPLEAASLRTHSNSNSCWLQRGVEREQRENGDRSGLSM